MAEAEGHTASVQPIDEAAFLSLIQPLLPVAQRLARGMLRSPSDAEDMVQEATLAADRDHFRTRRYGVRARSSSAPIDDHGCEDGLKFRQVAIAPIISKTKPTAAAALRRGATLRTLGGISPIAASTSAASWRRRP
jgi:Sigma-70 region 2